ncbi:hypothetical protein B0J14DRAFT_545256 [Halenospora varia]|nr:hypothetical protein B0J14DRAFT_545256 [Halenospora varia]
MSTNTTIRAKPSTFEAKPSTTAPHNPFDTVFDGEESGDEWCEDDTLPSSPAAIGSTLGVPQKSKTIEANGTASAGKSISRTTTRKHDRKYSVHKPIREKSKGRQKKQNARAGIKVVTDFTTHKPQPQPVKPLPQTGCFVDLAALQALDGGQKPAAAPFWKTRKNKGSKDITRAHGSSETSGPGLKAIPNHMYSAHGGESHLAPSPLDPRSALSPNDRPIVIGLSIPQSDVSIHSVSPQTATSLHVPETPTIIITPAKEGSVWSPFDEGSDFGNNARATSSIYSREVASQERFTSRDAPPVPAVPSSALKEEQQRQQALKSCFSPDSDDGTTWDATQDSPNDYTSRVMSSYTVFEEDESPVIARKARGLSVSVQPGRHASVSTVATNRRSRGWWNYITTPFLTRSNTFANRSPSDENPPALPSLAIAATKAQDEARDQKLWEKQFSPLTPETSTTIQSDSWWNVDSKSPANAGTKHKVQASTATVPFMLSEVHEEPRLSNISDHSHSGPDDVSRGQQPASPASPASNVRAVPIMFEGDAPTNMQSNNPYVQPQPHAQPQQQDLNNASSSPPPPTIIHQVSQPAQVIVNRPSFDAPPPPPYSPAPSRQPRYRAVFPPGHELNVQQDASRAQQPASPGPITPGMQQAMASSGAIPMSNVPLTPADRAPINLTAGRGPINLNSSYPQELPPRQNRALFTTDYIHNSSDKARKIEAKRRRHEKEDAVARKAGGWWRGRGCIPKSGCYGRKGAEGRKKRRCYIALIIAFLLLIALIVALATTLTRKPNTNIGPSQWLNLTGFPPIFAGLSTIAAPINTVANTGCVVPATQWSCDLPKELQASAAPNPSNQPNFLMNIQWDNSSETNATFRNVTGNPKFPTRAVGGNPVSAGQFIKSLLRRAAGIVTFVPSPAPPTFAEGNFLGNTTDGIVSSLKAGEPTPFYITFLPTSNSSISRRSLIERQTADNSSSLFPNTSSIIPAPSILADGTAAGTNLLPLPVQQPIRLYDRGLPTEHYGFYSYYDRSIFLKSLDSFNGTEIVNTEVPEDQHGGASKGAAQFRCTWTQTRFLVQMWTRMNSTARLLNGTHTSKNPATDFSQPGSFPYPITVTVDRHGGDATLKMLYCYPITAKGTIVPGTGKIMPEAKGFGGTIINPSADLFFNASNPSLGGFDGGTGGCKCQWNNFNPVVVRT